MTYQDQYVTYQDHIHTYVTYQDGCDDKSLIGHCVQGAPLVRLLLHPENLYHKQILNHHPAQKLFITNVLL